MRTVNLALLTAIVVTASESSLRSEETTIWQHDASVSTVCAAPDGTYAATGTSTGKVTLWNLNNGSRRELSEAATQRISALAFSQDSKVLSVAAGRSLVLWSVIDGRVISRLKANSGSIDSLAFSPGGKKLAGTGKGLPVAIWRLENQAAIGELSRETENGGCVVFLTDDHLRIGAASNGSILVLDIEFERTRPIAVASYRDWSIDCMAFSRDGEALAFGASHTVDDGLRSEIHVWDLKEAGQQRPTQELTDVAVVNDPAGILPTWGYALRGHRAPIWCLAFSADGKRIASASGSYFRLSGGVNAVGAVDSARIDVRENAVRLWDLDLRRQILSHDIHVDSVKSVDFLPGDTRILSGSLDKTARLLSAKPSQ
jgi:WD40 repeat protein